MAQLVDTPLFNDANLVAYYKLEDVNDSKGTFNLTNNGTIPFNIARYGLGADGGTANTSKYLEVANNLGITGGSITMAGWILRNTEISSSTEILWEQRDSTNKISFKTLYDYNAGNRQISFIRTRLGTTGAGTSNYSVTFGTTNYNHVAFTYDATNIIGYVNGSVSGTISVAGNGNTGAANNFTILSTTGGGNYFSGIIDDVAVFSRALTAAEIGTLATDVSTAHYLTTNSKFW